MFLVCLLLVRWFLFVCFSLDGSCLSASLLLCLLAFLFVWSLVCLFCRLFACFLVFVWSLVCLFGCLHDSLFVYFLAYLLRVGVIYCA